MDDQQSAGEQTRDTAWIIRRPPQMLQELPLSFRWEVTRRHPYYLGFWAAAHRFYQQPSADPKQRLFEQAAILLLRLISVTGDPPPPHSSWESLGGGQLSAGWVSGAVAPITLRGLACILHQALPPEVRREIAQIWQGSNNSPSETSAQLDMLQRLSNPALNSYPDAPIVGINVNAPQRAILQAMTELSTQWKKERNIPEQRRRDDKLKDYLAVWDLREGWVDDHYERGQEKTLREIAEQLKLSPSTLSNRYKSAFRLIVGHDFTPELWFQLFVPLKYNRLVDPSNQASRSLRRPRRSKGLRTVSETTLAANVPDQGEGGQEQEAGGLLNNLKSYSGGFDMVDLELDIRDLIEKHRTNEEILAELELSPECSEVIDDFRSRIADFR